MKARGPETMSAMSPARCAARPSPTLHSPYRRSAEPSALRTSARLGAERHHSGVDGHPTCSVPSARILFKQPNRGKKEEEKKTVFHCDETVGQRDSRVINKRGQPAGRAEICSTERDFSHVLPFSANGGTKACTKAGTVKKI